MSTSSPTCNTCARPPTEGTRLQVCARCRSSRYCSAACQRQDWPTHKTTCGKAWWDNKAMRKCEDGALHSGNLELITWSTPAADNEFGWALGWGACMEDEADDLKAKFEGEFEGDEKKLFEYWPQGFRWTCCGTSADMKYGCDHHGTGKSPCTCDFCRMGKPLTESIYNKALKSAHGKGLNLSRGPDPRSYNSASAAINEMARGVMGMDN